MTWSGCPGHCIGPEAIDSGSVLLFPSGGRPGMEDQRVQLSQLSLALSPELRLS